MHNFPKGVEVICKTKHNLKQAKEIFHLAIDVDIIIEKGTLEKPVDVNFPYFSMRENGNLDQTSKTIKNYSNNLFVSFEEFKAFFLGKGKYKPVFKEEILLNNSYKAIVTKEKIVVGCQEFTHGAIKNLYESSQKALKS